MGYGKVGVNGVLQSGKDLVQRGKGTEKENNVKNIIKKIWKLRYIEGRKYENPSSRMLPR